MTASNSRPAGSQAVGEKRWTPYRKAALVAEVRNGRMSRDEACIRHGLSIEEFTTWQRQLERHGTRGLRITRLQTYRDEARPDRTGPSPQFKQTTGDFR